MKDSLETRLAALITSRICHDLASPLGAIQNGMELLELSGVEQTGEMDLVTKSITAANAKLRLYRIAFGAMQMSSELSERDINSILSQTFTDTRTSVDWILDGPQPLNQLKTVFLLILCYESLLKRGGKIRVRKADNSWAVCASSESFEPNQGMVDLLTGAAKSEDLEPSMVQFELLNEIFEQTNATLEIEVLPNKLRSYIVWPSAKEL